MSAAEGGAYVRISSYTTTSTYDVSKRGIRIIGTQRVNRQPTVRTCAAANECCRHAGASRVRTYPPTPRRELRVGTILLTTYTTYHICYNVLCKRGYALQEPNGSTEDPPQYIGLGARPRMYEMGSSAPRSLSYNVEGYINLHRTHKQTNTSDKQTNRIFSLTHIPR